MSLLKGEALALARGGRLLFEGLDIALAAGEAIHITGPNGCGKSSLIRLVAGLLKPTAGRIERAEAALADDTLPLDRELPLRRALMFWGDARLRPAMEAFDLAGLAEVPVRLLSTGQRRRAALARVLASGADLWLLDEPATGLDTASVALLEAAVARQRARGGIAVVATHQPLDVAGAASLDLAAYRVVEAA